MVVPAGASTATSGEPMVSMILSFTGRGYAAGG
jgi:hypothetical protein